MKKTLSLILALLLCVSLLFGCGAKKPEESIEEPAQPAQPLQTAPPVSVRETPYQLGDKIEDCTVTLCDGSTTTIYELLENKKVLLLNFWATYCGPCRVEFPFMQETYAKMSDDVAVLAVSGWEDDTNESVANYKKELGLTFPMAWNVDLVNNFNINAFPTSVAVDRNGIICLIHTGLIPEAAKFERLFSVFTAENYSEPLLLTAIPAALPDIKNPTAAQLESALNIQSDKISVEFPDDEYAWPYLPVAEGASASNSDELDSHATLMLKVDANAGEALSFEYTTALEPLYDLLTVEVDGKYDSVYSDYNDWTTDYVTFDTSGTHTVKFNCVHNPYASNETDVTITNVKLLTTDEAVKIASAASAPAKTLEGAGAEISVVKGESKAVLVEMAEPGQELTPENALESRILTSDTLTLRIKLGKDVNDKLAYISDGINATMISSLPTDSEGYLYTYTKDPDSESSALQISLSVFASVLEQTEPEIAKYDWFDSEQMADEYTNTVKMLLKQYYQIECEIAWVYADGSKRLTEPAQSAAQTSSVGQYNITVIDEQGKPVSGVMLQICDESTCSVENTDENGMVSLTMTPYPYEIHVLKVPDGFAHDDTTYKLPETGGSIVIELKKA